ncbi:hypothetical protein [Sorangium sp. So ce145]|uniref:hypothetical protein n=1 Tax=Sorangium sp. So ce145 TaxID=3133285 RepID=UPI003F632DCD
MYRPDPTIEAPKAIRVWLYGISWHLVSHYPKSARIRHMVFHPSPLGLISEPVGPSLEAQVAARDVLATMAKLPLWQLEALLSVGDPESASGSAG